MCNEYTQKLTTATANRERTEIVVAWNWTEMTDALELNVVVVCSSKTTVVTYLETAVVLFSETAVVLCSETAAMGLNDLLLQRSVSHIQSYNVLPVVKS